MGFGHSRGRLKLAKGLRFAFGLSVVLKGFLRWLFLRGLRL